MDNNDLRNRIIGLGKQSFKKSYYPELQKRISELNLFKSVVDQVNDKVIVFNPLTGEIEYVNDSGKLFFSISDDIKSVTLEDVFELVFWEQIKDAFKKHVELSKSFKFSTQYAADAEIKYIENSVNLIESNNIQFGVLVIRDITESILGEKELLKAKEKAEESNRLKSAFLANMSHEIRTPMNGILGFVSLLEDSDINRQSRTKYMEIIKASSEDLLRIIDDILDISKIESGSVNLYKNMVDFDDILDSLGEIYNHKIKALGKPVKFVIEKHYGNNSNVFADGIRVKQILRNLIDNALKFSHHGEIRVRYNITHANLEVSVSDEGIGIQPEKLKVIFERFRQSEENISRTYGGTGLGLSICKGLLDLMEGSVDVVSEYGKGSTFTFKIPVDNHS